jgi:hypothetical protein
MADQKTRNLLIVHTPDQQALQDWETVQTLISERAPDIEVRIGENGRPNSVTRRWQTRRPSLVFSLMALESYRPPGGKVYAGLASDQLGKFEEYQRLHAAELPVLETVRLSREPRLTGAQWHPYVVVKPEWGARGKGIRLVRTVDLTDRYNALTRDGRWPMVVQPYVDHVDGEGRPTTYRVLTLFGRELQAGGMTMSEPRGPLEQLAANPNAIIAVNHDSVTRLRKLIFDEDIIALGCAAHRAFPDVPALGVDIVREAGTGRLIVMETNPKGSVWHFSSRLGGKNLPPESRQRMYAQFNALERTADLLIEKTRAEAI